VIDVLVSSMFRNRPSSVLRKLTVVGMLWAVWSGWQPAQAQAATWSDQKTTPSVRDLLTLDATGETNWPYGNEDVLGDTAGVFSEQEQGHDFRSLYVAVDPAKIWFRAYVSHPATVTSSLLVYVFADSDNNPMTGGSSQAPEIATGLASGTAVQGFETVVEIQVATAKIHQVWRWNSMVNQYQTSVFTVSASAVEIGADLDPLQLGSPNHGYVQISVPLKLVGITESCQARFQLRTLHDNTPTTSDLDVGQPAACVNEDKNQDKIPDILIPISPCSETNPCPAGGVCTEGSCVLAIPCTKDSHCADDQQCTMEGKCVVRPTDTCKDNSTCGTLVCVSGKCSPCSQGTCGGDLLCSPSGECINKQGEPTNSFVPSAPPSSGESSSCSMTRTSSSYGWLALLMAGLAFRRRKS
jgi:MYXO-CTERM domain-containing protein